MKIFIFRDNQSAFGCSFVIKNSFEEAVEELKKVSTSNWHGRFALYMALGVDAQKLFAEEE